MKAHFTAGLDGTSAANQNLYNDLKAQEVAKNRSWRPWQAYAFYAKSDCYIQINGDTDNIRVFANVPFSGTGEITSFIVVDSGIEFGFAVEY